jgi:hypothetical protein
MSLDNFLVRPKRRYIEKYAAPPAWARLDADAHHELIEHVASVAAKPSKPLDNTDLTHPYRKKMTRVFVARALRRLAGLSEGGGARA